jgi:hypothetical protein
MFGTKLFSNKPAFDKRNSSAYAALRGGAGDDDSSSPSEKEFDEPMFTRQRSNKRMTAFNCAVILLLVVTNILTVIGLFATKHLINNGLAGEPKYTPKSAGMASVLKIW